MKKKDEFRPTPCRGCYYWRPITHGISASTRACHYCIDTGQLRSIPPQLCYQKPGTPYRPGKKAFKYHAMTIYRERKQSSRRMAPSHKTGCITE